MEIPLSLLLFASFLASVMSLECYVCQNQMDNKDKCIKTSVQCREDQDTCLNYIEWRAPNFWTPRSEKIHYIHKSCNTTSYCAEQQSKLGLKCMRDWYRDWACVECCQGDRCNFYVTLGAGSVFPSAFIIVSSIVAVMLSQSR